MRWLLVFLLLLGVPALADTRLDVPVRPSTRIPECPGWTYLTLLHRIMPDLHKTGAGWEATRLARLHTTGGTAYHGDGPWEVWDLTEFHLTDHGEPLLVLALNAHPRLGAMALFSLRGRPHLLDAVVVTEVEILGIEDRVEVHPDHPAFMVNTFHDNSSESFDTLSLFGVLDHHFHVLFDQAGSFGYVLSIGSKELCKIVTQDTVTLGDARTGGFRNLVVTSRHLVGCHPSDAEWEWKSGILKDHTTVCQARWNGTRYETPRQPAEHATGTVAFFDGDRDAEFGLLTEDRLLTLDAGQMQHTPQLGERWTVTYEGREVTAARRLPGRDMSLLAASEVLQKHFESLSNKDYRTAYADLSQAWQQTQSYEAFESGHLQADVHNEAMRKVISYRTGQVQIRLLAGQWIPDATGTLLVTLVQEQGRWVIDRVQERPLADWW